MYIIYLYNIQFLDKNTLKNTFNVGVLFKQIMLFSIKLFDTPMWLCIIHFC